MFLMALVQTPLGKTVNGARRWIRLPGGLSLQPAEITKVAVILFIAYEICLLGQKAKKWDGIKILLFYGIIAFFGAYKLTDNLSTAVIILSITVVLIFVVHPKTKPFVAGVIAVGIVGIIGIICLKYTLAESDNFRMRRIIACRYRQLSVFTGIICDRFGRFLWKGTWKQYTEAACNPGGTE